MSLPPPNNIVYYHTLDPLANNMTAMSTPSSSHSSQSDYSRPALRRSDSSVTSLHCAFHHLNVPIPDHLAAFPTFTDCLDKVPFMTVESRNKFKTYAGMTAPMESQVASESKLMRSLRLGPSKRTTSSGSVDSLQSIFKEGGSTTGTSATEKVFKWHGEEESEEDAESCGPLMMKKTRSAILFAEVNRKQSLS